MSPNIMPMVIVPLSFLFVLLIILITKAPKVGAWVVGGLVFLTPVVLLRFAHSGMLSHGEAIPLVVVPLSFLFVLLIILLSKSPKAGVGLVIAIVVMVVFGLAAVFFARSSPHQSATVSMADGSYQWAQVRQQTAHNDGTAIIGDPEKVYEGLVSRLDGAPAALESGPYAPIPSPPVPSGPASPIWSQGVEQEFEADVYPSVLAAAKALGRRMVAPIRSIVGDPNAPVHVVIFQEGNNRGLVSSLGGAIENGLSGVKCSVEADMRNVRPGEVGLTLRQEARVAGTRRISEGPDVERVEPVEGGRIVGTAFIENKRVSAEADYIDKPWVEGFGVFASERPNDHFIVARSNGACTSEGEARQQAFDDARARLNDTLGRQSGRRFRSLSESPITTMDVDRGGFVADSFVQSFDGSVGKIWRHAILVDVSGPKLSQLAQQKQWEAHSVRESWAWMGLSAVGVLLLIGAIYFFLNMATRGYYEWSLRIAGAVLAIVAIVSILMIVH